MQSHGQAWGRGSVTRRQACCSSRGNGEASPGLPAGRALFAEAELPAPTGISPKLEVLGPGQQRTAGPSGQLVAVVLQLGGDDGPSLGIQLLTPVDAVTVLREESPGHRSRGRLPPLAKKEPPRGLTGGRTASRSKTGHLEPETQSLPCVAGYSAGAQQTQLLSSQEFIQTRTHTHTHTQVQPKGQASVDVLCGAEGSPIGVLPAERERVGWVEHGCRGEVRV